ncbi:hypothetical protein [Amycolatopsis rhizosphaerae]|uniref:hypothetical protein n=1 Tax=Amycolatopsis rhizosphaerae TaxID=2053003 RepID=UPI001643F6ED|nr:hypothetical protein [Amycolatopsis rhizosphaerae]
MTRTRTDKTVLAAAAVVVALLAMTSWLPPHHGRKGAVDVRPRFGQQRGLDLGGFIP